MTNEKQPNRIKQFFNHLKIRYHLSVVNKTSLEEIYSRNISLGMIFIWVLGISMVVFVSTVSIIVFTPIKSWIPGLESEEMYQKWLVTTKHLIELEKEVKGKIDYSLAIDSNLIPFGIIPDSINEMEMESKHSVNHNEDVLPDEYISFAEKNTFQSDLTYYHFFTPITGLVSKEYALDQGHYGIDIVSEKNEAVKSTLDGIVILSAWTAETGNIIAIQHSNNLMSIYKHNSVVLKKEGDVVKAGEVIAIVGNSGEFSTGPHLHFEIWYQGSPLNPTEIMKFD